MDGTWHHDHCTSIKNGPAWTTCTGLSTSPIMRIKSWLLTLSLNQVYTPTIRWRPFGVSIWNWREWCLGGWKVHIPAATRELLWSFKLISTWWTIRIGITSTLYFSQVSSHLYIHLIIIMYPSGNLLLHLTQSHRSAVSIMIAMKLSLIYLKEDTLNQKYKKYTRNTESCRVLFLCRWDLL